MTTEITDENQLDKEHIEQLAEAAERASKIYEKGTLVERMVESVKTAEDPTNIIMLLLAIKHETLPYDCDEFSPKKATRSDGTQLIVCPNCKTSKGSSYAVIVEMENG